MSFKTWLSENSNDNTRVYIPGDSGRQSDVQVASNSNATAGNGIESFRLFYGHNRGNWNEVVDAVRKNPQIANILRDIEKSILAHGWTHNVGQHANILQAAITEINPDHGHKSSPEEDLVFGSSPNNNNEQPANSKAKTRILGGNETIKVMLDKFRAKFDEIESRVKNLESRIGN